MIFVYNWTIILILSLINRLSDSHSLIVFIKNDLEIIRIKNLSAKK